MKSHKLSGPAIIKTFIKEINRRSGWEQTLKREGNRAAYQEKPFYWELDLTTPRHGDRPWEVCHIDHTKLDIELRCSRIGQVLGRPWATFLVDAMSRRILAVYFTKKSKSGNFSWLDLGMSKAKNLQFTVLEYRDIQDLVEFESQ